MLEKLKKIKGRSFDEYKTRARQSANVFAEKFGVSSQTKLPTDASLFKKFDLQGKTVSTQTLFEHFRWRKAVKFYASFENPAATIELLRARFPEEEAAIVKRADRICQGFFDLLGFENLYFNGVIPDWHFDPISEKTSAKIHWSQIEEVNAAQTGDKKIIWELNRHQYFTTLGRAYWLTGNERYAETFAAHLESWLIENPPKTGVNWLSSLEIAFRSMSWIWAFHFFKDAPAFKPEIFAAMLKYLYLNGRHLETYLSTYFSPNTHLTGEALGLYFLGSFLPELGESKRWKNLGYKILLGALDFQVRGDGGYCEQSSHYHRYTTDFYANLFVLRELENEKINEKHREKLNQLFDFLLHTIEPNGEHALFGDDDGGRFYFFDERPTTDFRPTLGLGAALLARGDLKFAAKAASAELLWLLGAEGLRRFDEIEIVEPKETAKAFERSGFFAWRSCWKADADFVLIDCGEHGFLNGGHAHADALSFVLSLDGAPVFVDSGTYNYTSDLEARRLFRSTGAHNCLTVSGESSSIPGGAFSWETMAKAELLDWRASENSVYFRGKHDGFERFGVRYERGISLQKNGSFRLVDSIKSDEANVYELNFILAPNLAAEIKNGAVNVFAKKNRAKILLNIYTETVAENSDGEGTWKIENCWTSPRYGKKVESKRLVFTARTTGNVEFATAIVKNANQISASKNS